MMNLPLALRQNPSARTLNRLRILANHLQLQAEANQTARHDGEQGALAVASKEVIPLHCAGNANQMAQGWGKIALYTGVGVSSVLFYLLAIKFKPRDFAFAWKGLKATKDQEKASANHITTAELFAEALATAGDKRPCYYFENKVFTYGDIDRLSNRVANWALSLGLNAKDSVSLYMENCPEFVAIWLGFAKIGVRTFLINHNLKLDAFVHSINISKSNILVFGSSLASSVEEIQPELKEKHVKLSAFSFGTEVPLPPFAESLDEKLNAASDKPVPADKTARGRGVKFDDPVLYIYTSGTTGMPKAAIINHARFRRAGKIYELMLDVTADDRIYCALPLYHSSATLIGVGMQWLSGASMIIERKFSASQFWPQVRKHNATIIQYIGELCRYLLAQPPHKDDAKSNVRIAVGNGLREDIWEQFQKRFNIGKICEFYAATEGVAGYLNPIGKVGAVGFVSPLVSRYLPAKVVKIDPDTGDPIRGKDGFCIECATDEPGEMLAKIMVMAGVSNYSGYTDNKSSQSKILANVFEKGDQYFRSGDLLKVDRDGFVYFVDRLGDTFRWKGENVSTTEVQHGFLQFIKGKAFQEVNVYGVKTPAQDGRAGMAAVVLSNDLKATGAFDLKALSAHVTKQLPVYARPLFLRILPEMEITSTFKHRKVSFVTEGYNPSAITDKLYFYDVGTLQYVPLTPQVYQQIETGVIKL